MDLRGIMKINTMGSDHINTDEIQPLDRLWGEGHIVLLFVVNR